VIKVCVDRRLDVNQLLEVADRAIEEHPANAPREVPTGPITRRERERLALLTGSAWKPGRTVRVGFLSGSRAVRARVQAIAEQWRQHANIAFEFGTDADAEIRIGFSPGGSWSLIGTEALGAANGAPTMNLGWLTPDTTDEEYSQVVLHEFGHALGCVHEHQSPAAGIPWDREAVYRYYAGPPNGWSREEVDLNIFDSYERDQTQFSEFDEASIMLYPVPNELAIGDFEIGWNSSLSETDKSFIAARYPFADTSTPRLESGAPAVAGAIRLAGEADEYQFDVGAAGSFVLETFGSTDVVMSLFGPNSKLTPVAEDDDSGLGQNAKIEEFLMEGTYYVRVGHKRETGTGPYKLSLIQLG
jgi:hypothetical protein